ncbi:hypothetical protein ILYODFUR_035459 [Ilyodon furcidens]|uniref:Uncharacterized protein n=1 Tax=Ilyodon furcidens TaxID=33524 RepID=A0ABV0ULQ4_9TELE
MGLIWNLYPVKTNSQVKTSHNPDSFNQADMVKEANTHLQLQLFPFSDCTIQRYWLKELNPNHTISLGIKLKSHSCVKPNQSPHLYLHSLCISQILVTLLVIGM